MELLYERYLPILIHLFELMGIIILTIGGFRAFAEYLKKLNSKEPYKIKYQFAASLATALEFKLVAEILKTVLIKSLDELIILASIFLLRVLMTFVLEWEIKQAKNHNSEDNHL